MCSWGDGSQESLLPGGGVIPIQTLGVSSNKLDKEEGRGAVFQPEAAATCGTRGMGRRLENVRRVGHGERGLATVLRAVESLAVP